MLYDNTFKFALVISAVVHSAILYYHLPNFANPELKKSLSQIEVTYYKLKLMTQDAKSTLEKYKSIDNKPYPDSLDLLKKKNPVLNRKDSLDLFKKIEQTLTKPASTSKVYAQKKVTIPEISTNKKIKNPSYNSYYQNIREKIRRSAYDNYKKFETGEVYLTFIINADGLLKEVKLFNEETTAPDYLKDVALKSIKDASPFPRFPNTLSYPELSFNIVISFEIEK